MREKTIETSSFGKNLSVISFHYVLNIWFKKNLTENTAYNNYIVVCVFVAVGTHLPSRYLTKIKGIRRHRDNKVIP
jgi:hypothetical protein